MAAPTSWSPPTGPRATSTRRTSSSSRSTRTPRAYDGGHIPGAVKLDWKTDLQDQVRRDFVNKAAVRGAAVRARASATTTPSSSTAATTTGSPPTRTGTSSSTATRTSSCSTAAARSGSSTAASWSPTSVRPARRPRTRAKDQDTSIRAFRDEVVAAIGAKNLVDVRSPDEFAGQLLAPAHLPQEQAQRAGPHPDRAQRAVEQGRQRGRHLQVRRRAAQALRRGRPGRRARTPSPTAASASARRTPGSCCRSCSATRTSRTTTAPGPSTARSSGVPIELGRVDHVRRT